MNDTRQLIVVLDRIASALEMLALEATSRMDAQAAAAQAEHDRLVREYQHLHQQVAYARNRFTYADRRAMTTPRGYLDEVDYQRHADAEHALEQAEAALAAFVRAHPDIRDAVEAEWEKARASAEDEEAVA